MYTWIVPDLEKKKKGKAPGKQHLPQHTGEGRLTLGMQLYITTLPV